MTAFLRPKKPPFIRAEPGSHGDQWLMSEADLEEYARADRAQQLELPEPAALAQRNKAPVSKEPASVCRELMALARRDVITDRDRILIGMAIGLIGNTHPAALPELSDAEIGRLVDRMDNTHDSDLLKFARAVIAAMKGKQ